MGLYDELQKLGPKENRYDYFLEGKNEPNLVETIRRFATRIISRKAKRDGEWTPKIERMRNGFDLLNPFSIHGFFSSSTKIPLPVYAPYKTLLFSHLDMETAAAAANFAARMGLETLSLALPLTFSLEDKPKEVNHLIYIGEKKDLDKIGLKKSQTSFNSEWKSGIFLLPTKERIPDVLICGEGKGLKGILNYLGQIPMSSRGAETPVFETIKKYFNELREFISRKEEKIGVPKEVVKEYTIPDGEERNNENTERRIEKRAEKDKLY